MNIQPKIFIPTQRTCNSRKYIKKQATWTTKLQSASLSRVHQVLHNSISQEYRIIHQPIRTIQRKAHIMIIEAALTWSINQELRNWVINLGKDRLSKSLSRNLTAQTLCWWSTSTSKRWCSPIDQSQSSVRRQSTWRNTRPPWLNPESESWKLLILWAFGIGMTISSAR